MLTFYERKITMVSKQSEKALALIVSYNVETVFDYYNYYRLIIQRKSCKLFI